MIPHTLFDLTKGQKPSYHHNESIFPQPPIEMQEKSTLMTKNKEKTHNNEEEDRISQLPDALLHHILSLIPFKCAVRTTILSNRWNKAWERIWPYTTAIDFGKEFSSSESSLPLASDTINRLLLLHRGKNIESFRLYFYPLKLFRPDIEKWIEFAVEKRVKALDLDFTDAAIKSIYVYKVYKPPPCLYSCDSLTILKLAGCKFELPSGFGGFSSLQALHLTNVDIVGDMFDAMLKCPVLEELALIGCPYCFWDPKIIDPSVPGLKIKSFTLIGCLVYGNAVLFLSAFAVLRNLTLCHFSADYIDSDTNMTGTFENSPMLSNLIELQWRVCDGCSLAGLYDLLGQVNLPCLKKLQLQWIPDSNMEKGISAPSWHVFHHLKTIKMDGFYGSKRQMLTVKFLLEKAIVLETMVLVTPKEVIKGSEGNDSISQANPNKASLKLLHEQLLLIPKVSKNAQFVLYENAEGDHSSLATDIIDFCCCYDM